MNKGLVVLKGAREGLRVIINDSVDFSLVIAELSQTISAADDFFQGAQIIVETGNRKLSEEEIKQLEEIIVNQNGLGLRRITGRNWELSYDNESKIGNYRELDTQIGDMGIKQQSQFDVNSPESDTILLKRTVRSGQRISFYGNIAVLGDVNAGAEIIAGGNIVVMGTLRGVAHAGAAGDREALVVAFRLLPTQLRIADFISRSPDEKVLQPVEPEVARIKGDNIIIETYVSNK